MKIDILLLKIILFVVIIIQPLSSKTFDLFNNFEYKKAWANYVGIAYNGSSILVYAKDGTVLFSTDGGTSWKQREINDTLIIASITNFVNKFVAISTDGIIWESTNNGDSWNFQKSLDIGNCQKIISNNNLLYLLTTNKILELTPNYEITSEHNYTTDTSVYDFVVTENKLFYSAGKGKLGVIDLKTKIHNLIDLSALGLCNICPAPKNLGIYNNENIFFLLNNNLFFFNTYSNKIDSIISLVSGKVTTPFKKYFLDFYFTLWPKSLSDSFWVYQIDPETKKIERFNSSCNRYLASSKLTKAYWVGGDTIVAVGKNNLVFISYDGAKNWNAVSYLNLSPKNFFVFDRNNVRAVYTPINFGFTNNGGSTWMHLRNRLDEFDFDEGLQKNDGFFKDTRNGMYYVPDNPVITRNGGDSCKMVYQKSLYGILQPNFFTYKNLYFVRTSTNYKDTIYNILYFLDDTVGMVKRSYFANKYFLLVPPDNPWSDTLFALTFPKDQSSYHISYSVDTGLTWTEYFQIPFDGNYILDNLKLKKYGSNFFIFALKPISDTVAINELFLFNWNSKQFTKLFEFKGQEINNFGNMVKINDTSFYLVYYYFAPKPSVGLLVNYNFFKDPTNWQKYDFTGKRYRITSIYSSVADSVLFVFASDTLLNELTAFILWKEQTSSVVESPKVEQNPIFMLTEPIPQPTKEKASFKIYFDYRYDFNNFKFECYNILGMKILGEDYFRMNLLNHYTAEATVTTENLPRGLYIIAVRLDKETKVIPLVVE